MQRGDRACQVLCINTELSANAGGEVRGDLEDSVVAWALAPQVHEVLAEVLIEVVGSVGVGYQDGEGRPLKLTALELFEPGGKTLAAVEGYEIRHECLPSLLSFGIHNMGFGRWGRWRFRIFRVL
jgi:hypothetical protein